MADATRKSLAGVHHGMGRATRGAGLLRTTSGHSRSGLAGQEFREGTRGERFHGSEGASFQGKGNCGNQSAGCLGLEDRGTDAALQACSRTSLRRCRPSWPKPKATCATESWARNPTERSRWRFRPVICHSARKMSTLVSRHLRRLRSFAPTSNQPPGF